MVNLEVIERAIVEIRKSAANNEYFFDNLTSSEWIRPLYDRGFFRHPPAPIKRGDYVSFPFWPESRYLSRMVRQAPELVFKMTLQIPETENIRVKEDLVDIAKNLPIDMAIQLVPRARSWIDTPYSSVSLLRNKLGYLVSYLSREGKVQPAIDLARSILDILPDSTTSEYSRLTQEPQAKVSIWDYEQLLEQFIPDLISVAGCDALSLQCDLLEKAIRISRTEQSDDTEVDYLHIWRPAIEEDGGSGGDRIDTLLITAIRKSAEELLGREGKAVLDIVERYPFSIFKRIGIHLRRVEPQADFEGTAELVSNPDVIRDIGLWHELNLLLVEVFGSLPQYVQDSYVNIVGEGIRSNRLDEVDLAIRNRRWQYTRLWPIQEYLNGKWLQLFEQLKDEFGDIQQPGLVVSKVTTHVGPTSPMGEEDIQAMEVNELIDFLKTWMPTGEWDSPTAEGLGRYLTTVIAKRPSKYANAATQFQELDPTYVRSLIQGSRDGLLAGLTFPWQPVLELCRWVMTQPKIMQGPTNKEFDFDSDPDWGWTYSAIANLLSVGCENREGAIPFESREQTWEILRKLTEDPDPTPEYESQYGPPNMDFATLSINSVRGVALHASMRYASWVRRHMEEVNHGDESTSAGFDQMPEFREVLDRHLDPEYETTLTVRAVYGQWFNTLAFIDEQWAVDHTKAIFPRNENSYNLRRAAWDAFVIFNRPIERALTVLNTQYKMAVEDLSLIDEERRYFHNPHHKLAEHLMSFYWLGVLGYEESQGLIADFFSRAPESVRANALAFLGRSLHNADEVISPDTLDRLKRLMTIRIRAAQYDIGASELASFGWWFSSGRFDDVWVLSQLREVLRISGKVEPDQQVLEKMAELAQRLPMETLEVMSTMIQSATEPWQLSVWKDGIRKVLSTVISMNDEDVNSTAVELIHNLGARGFREFRNLLSESNTKESE